MDGKRGETMTRIWVILTTIFLAITATGAVHAQGNPLAPGWSLQNDGSTLRFQSTKKQTVVESHTFATFAGKIEPSGAVTIKVLLDSVNTNVDLRNVRMRFLFFETFTYPEATITAEIDPAVLSDLATKRRITIQQPISLDLHGVKKDYTADIVVTLISDDMVSVASAVPLSIPLANHNLTEGLTKLEEAAKVDVVPAPTVTFDFLFTRDGGAPAATTAAAPAPAPKSAALETQGNFDTEACLGRFEILSRTGNIFFATASARLDDNSDRLLDQLYDIISRCPGMVIEIGGHTDSDGSDATNDALSLRRAQAVEVYLERKGVPAARMQVKGYGETQPFVPNTSAENKARNRRIEFKVVG
jgi:OOP family OmpA-OmpF porin